MAQNKQDAVTAGPQSAMQGASNKGPEAAREGATDKATLIRERDEALALAARSNAQAQEAIAAVMQQFGKSAMALITPQQAGKLVRVQFTRAYSFGGLPGVKALTYRIKPFTVKAGEIRDVPEEVFLRVSSKHPTLMEADRKKWTPRKIVRGRKFDQKAEKWIADIVEVSIEDLESYCYVVGYPRQ